MRLATKASDLGHRTYLVEDNALIRENLEGTLEELAGARVVGFSETEDDGVRWLHKHPNDWDLAIVDVFLREGSGLGVASACQQRQPHQKLVMLTNYATRDIRARCASLGVDAVFDKSNEIEDLMDFCVKCRLAMAAAPTLSQSGDS